MKEDFLTLDDITRNEMFDIFELAKYLKREPYSRLLDRKDFMLLFFKPSTRTRTSFQVGISQMGGGSFYFDATTTQMSRGETPEDTANTLERYVDCLIIRIHSHETLERMAKALDKPIINALSELAHPCQILADILTIDEKFEGLDGIKLAYVGDGNNICNSLLLGCSKAGVDISVACPDQYKPNKNMVKLAKQYAGVTDSKVEVMSDPVEAVKDANIVYTDTFISMGQEEEAKKRMKVFLPKYQVNSKLMEKASSDALFMHCLPAHRGMEVTADVIDGMRSIVFDQAENRLHVQKALILKLMGLT